MGKSLSILGGFPSTVEKIELMQFPPNLTPKSQQLDFHREALKYFRQKSTITTVFNFNNGVRYSNNA
jgi:hypothetical protein